MEIELKEGLYGVLKSKMYKMPNVFFRNGDLELNIKEGVFDGFEDIVIYERGFVLDEQEMNLIGFKNGFAKCLVDGIIEKIPIINGEVNYKKYYNYSKDRKVAAVRFLNKEGDDTACYKHDVLIEYYVIEDNIPLKVISVLYDDRVEVDKGKETEIVDLTNKVIMKKVTYKTPITRVL